MEKRVDVVVTNDSTPIAGIGVKFVMSNYSQNSNNYFEGMLGETANIRCSNVPYFQVLIIPSRIPYYEEGGAIGRWETFPGEYLHKYLALSQDDTSIYMHSPVKTLVAVIDLPECNENKVTTRKKYAEFYGAFGAKLRVQYSSINEKVGKALILNDYEDFAEKISHYIQSL